jgi:type II secretory pathway component PulJ
MGRKNYPTVFKSSNDPEHMEQTEHGELQIVGWRFSATRLEQLEQMEQNGTGYWSYGTTFI